MRIRVLVALLAAVALTPPAAAQAHAGKHRTTLSEIESEVMCPTCGTTLQLANSPLAERQRAFILARVERNQTKEQIKAALVAEFGEQVLADPPRSGFAKAVYIVPVSTLAIVVLVVSLAIRRWRRTRDTHEPGEEASGPAAPEPGEEAAGSTASEQQRLDDELARFGV